MAAHSSILTWRIPLTEEPGGLQFMASKELDTTEKITHTHTDGRCGLAINLGTSTTLGSNFKKLL